MKVDLPTGSGFIEGHPCTIGRDGQIRINDPSLSRGHAEIRLIDGKLRLRDLGSTNGTYLVLDNKLVAIDECYVAPKQRVVMGSRLYTIKALLARVGIYVSYSSVTGLIVRSEVADQQSVIVKTDLDQMVSEAIVRMID